MNLVKTVGVTAAVVAGFVFAPATVEAHSYDTDDSAHPFRLIAYPLHAIGKGLEYGVTRPIHHCVSQPRNRHIFGHVSHPRTDDYWGDHDLYQRYSY